MTSASAVLDSPPEAPAAGAAAGFTIRTERLSGLRSDPPHTRRSRASRLISDSLRDCGADPIDWSYSATGKPVPADSRLLMSVSHCQDVLVVVTATTDQPGQGRLAGVGVDLEREGAIPEAAAHLVYSPLELAERESAGTGWLSPTAAFAAKEAVYKACDSTAPFQPRSMSLTPVADRPGATEFALEPRSTALVTLRQRPGFVLALAVVSAR